MEVVLTNMCMVYKGDQILVQNRVKKTWPGLTFPGGHVEKDEDHIKSIIREVKEETGLTLLEVEQVGFIEWFDEKTQVRDLCLLYRSSSFVGEFEHRSHWPFPHSSSSIYHIFLKNNSLCRRRYRY